ncbi:protoporphyrinogen oxidase [Natribacillus halophilus]|uniref:Coproporphyrinogen III oxidase n=1 Tax=Natribacillus halophilus TaxID=549003 RepID=A0A1G8NXJ2_9BACI|nr:protoporphyrinogen oxidase [Natribacillus halophilus]SDI84924.1 protoporphyrinogen oxidase [Natribacillus halophilus]
MNIAIIGGGITGLSALYELEKHRSESGSDIDVQLYEKSSALGGKIETMHRDGFTIERGPDSFLARKPELLSLVEDLGLSDQLVTNNTGQAFIVSEGQFHPIPPGSVMGIPTKAKPFLASSLLSSKGKMRATADLWLPAKQNEHDDESLGLFFRQRFGDELVDRILEPLLSGIYAGDIDELSLASTFPHFRDEKRSLILASRATAKKRQAKSGTGQQGGVFRTVKGGLSVVVDELEKAVPEGTIHREKHLQEIVSAAENGYRLFFADGTEAEADQVILTIPQEAAAATLPSLSVQEEMISTAAGASTATVAIALKESALESTVEGTGFLIPNGNDVALKAVTLVHKKWPQMVPEGYALLRCFVGRPGHDAIVAETDEAIVAQTLRELRTFLDIQEEPLFTSVTRWPEAMPKYTVGHQARIEKWTAALAREYPGVQLAGAFYRGIGLPDCVRQGQEAAIQTTEFRDQRSDA